MIPKFIVIAICVGVITAGKYHSVSYVEKCTKKLGIKPAEMKEYLNQEPLAMAEGNMRCVFKCLLQEMGYMDDHGHLTQLVQAHKLRKKCIALDEDSSSMIDDDFCERAFNYYDCFIGQYSQEEED